MIAAVATYVPRAAGRLMPNVLSRSNPRERVVHLTFDDGPTPQFTNQILDALDAHGAKASFFLLGKNVNRNPAEVREIVRRGHAVGGHTERHLDPWLNHVGAVIDDFEAGCESLESVTGTKTVFVRPPYGRLRPCIARWARTTGRRVVLWDVMPADYRRGADPERMTPFVLRRIRNGSIVVLHDNPDCSPRTPEMLGILLPRLREAGWRCSALD